LDYAHLTPSIYKSIREPPTPTGDLLYRSIITQDILTTSSKCIFKGLQFGSRIYTYYPWNGTYDLLPPGYYSFLQNSEQAFQSLTTFTGIYTEHLIYFYGKCHLYCA
jgi:hypothetical protein